MIDMIPMKIKIAILAVFGAVLFASGAAVAWKVQGSRLDALQARFDWFVENTKAIGEAAKISAEKKKRDDIANKERADNENAKTISNLRADIERMRNARSGSGYLPAPAASSKSIESACFHRAELERAIRQFDADISGIVAEGDESRVNLNTAKLWAKQLD